MRIIAGAAKGRRLYTPENRDIRPTSDRVRENLFNILVPRITNARFLDLFCGSGANGIEALSRGACHCTFVDNNTAALNLTRRNLELCKLSSAALILHATVPDGLPPQPNPFDIIFADPPYAFKEYSLLLQRLSENGYISDESMVILETSTKAEIPDECISFRLQQQRRYGDTMLSFFVYLQ